MAPATSKRKKPARGKRPVWSGFLRLSLVSVPVKAYTANASGHGETHLHQIHKTCHRRIKYQKTCPVHGPVPNDDIISGYELSKGHYVEIDPDELDQLRSESDKAVQIKAFIRTDEVDAVFFNGQTYYLLPDGPSGAKPYVLLRDGMRKLKRDAIVQTVLHGKEQLAMLRPLGKLLALTMLNYVTQIVPPSQIETDVPNETGAADEMSLIEALVKQQSARRLDLAAFKDTYTDRLRELIEARAKGKEIEAPAEEEPAQILNLMDALKKSVALTQQGNGHAQGHGRRGQPARKRTKRLSHHHATRRRRKSS